MQLDRVNQYIKDHNIYRYDVTYLEEGNLKTAYTLMNPAEKDPVELLMQTYKIFQPEKLYLRPRKKNGNSTKIQSDIIIDFADNDKPPVAENKPAVVPMPLNGLDSQPANTAAYGMYLAQLNDYKYQQELEKRTKAEREAEKYKTDYESLKAENAELKEQISFKDKEFELVMKEKESEHKNSLNGIIGTLKEPETIRTIGEVVVMLKGMSQPGQQHLGTGLSLPEGVRMEMIQDPIIKDVIIFLGSQKEQHKQKMYNLIVAAANRQIDVDQILNPINQAA